MIMPGRKSKFLNRISWRSWSVKPAVRTNYTFDDCAITIDVDAQGLGNTNRIGNLYHASFAETVGHQILGDPTGSIGS